MKKIVTILLSVFPLVMMGQERIMVIADPHVTPQSLIDANPDFDENMQHQRKMLDLSESIWFALMDTAIQHHPDLLLIPGDLTKDGEQEGHELVAASLHQLNEAGIRTLVIPGNHDLPANTQWDSLYMGTVTTKDPNSYSYAVEPLNGVTVIGIDGSHGSASTGSLSDQTLAWILAQADSAVAKGNMIIAMCHWQLLEHIDQQGSLESSCRLKEADAIRDSLIQHGVHLVLTGHFHVNGITTYRGEQQADSLVEITTGSPITFPCPYRWLTVSADRRALSVQTDYISVLDTIDNMYSYSREWMREHATNMIPQMTIRAWNKVENNLNKLDYLLDEDTKAELMECIPESDSAKIDLVQRHMGSTIVDLYLLHSEANEPEHPEADSLAQALYDGMEDLFEEVTANTSIYFKIIIVPMLENFGIAMAEGPVQSLVEDVTQRSTYADRTDDLNGMFFINNGYQVIETVLTESAPHKFMQNGQLIIQRGKAKYNALGQQFNK